MSPRAYEPLHRSSPNDELLDLMLDAVRQAATGCVAIFDLDGCLFDNRPRQQQILRHVAAELGLLELYRVRVDQFWDWDLRATLERAGIEPEWLDEHFEQVQLGWRSRFFTSEYCRYDHAMPGAVSLVRRVAAAGAHVVYLTGRDSSMRAGTEAALQGWGFPLGTGATLLVKPSPELDDSAFKDAALAQVEAIGMPVLLVDNEPRNVNIFHRRHPDALTVFVDTDHSFLPDVPDPGIPWLRSFYRG